MKKITLMSALMSLALCAQALTYNVTVPAGTKACYIAGGMNGWSFTEMTKVDDTHYTLDIASATEADSYKYCSGPSWSYVEKTAEGGEVSDRTYAANDEVAAWASVYEPPVGDIVYADITIKINAGTTVPTIWWWGGDIAGADQNYTWATKPEMHPVTGAEGWYYWTFENVNTAIGISYKIVIGSDEGGDMMTKADICLNAARQETACPQVGGGGDDPIIPVNPADYYLVGYINGADYGCEADYENVGEYKFVDGALTATFTQDSYVFVKTGDNSNWYMAMEYVAASPATLYNTVTTTAGEKMFVPGNVVVDFTLAENADGTLQLAYTTGGTAVENVQVNYTCRIENGVLALTLDQAAQVAVYTLDGQMLDMQFTSDYRCTLNAGIYIVRVGNTAEKMVVF